MSKNQFKSTLYKQTSNGGVSTYSIEIHHFDNHSEVRRYHGLLNGKIQCDTSEITEGVNIGKSNETTIAQQAERIANTYWNKLLDQGYKTEIPNDDDLLTNAYGLPKAMLAQSLKEKHKSDSKGLFKNNSYVYVQPKLNGARALSVFIEKYDSLKLITRNCKKWTTVDHILVALKQLEESFGVSLRNIIPDGELYIHGMLLQDIVSALKKENIDTIKIRFILYDVAIPNISQDKRVKILGNIKEHIAATYGDSFPIQVLKTEKAYSMEEVERLFNSFKKEGYEGAIIRIPSGKYNFGHRSKDLLKHKDMVEEEFEIVDVKEAKGRDKGTGIFIVKNKRKSTKPTFDVRPEGSNIQRAEYLKNKHKYIGKLLTVRYQELSKDNVPIFPVGVVIRDYDF